MKRQIAAGVSILGMALGVGWTLASHPETSTGLQQIQLSQRSEHARPGVTNTLAGIRVRISPGDANRQLTATARPAPHIAVAVD
jgi:hypothetical protein